MTTTTTSTAIDDAVQKVASHKESWATLSVTERIAILIEIERDMQTVADRWVLTSTRAKGLSPRSFGEGEEWLAVATIYRQVRLLRQSLMDIRRSGRPQVPGPITTRSDGQVVARVFPQTLIDRLMLPGVSGDVWLESGVTQTDLMRDQASFYQQQNRQGKVVLVLGAGNNSSLIPGDFLYKLFVEGYVVVLKPNPVNDYLGPLIEQGFRALVKRGFLALVHGGAEVGDQLCHHPAIDAIHMTGSRKTYESIVFGEGQAADDRKSQGIPRLHKPITAELGNISPLIIVPGPWRAADINIQARRIASWFVFNSAFGCLTPRVLIQWHGWDKRVALTQAIGRVLAQTPTRRAYYPGATDLYETFLAVHPEAQPYGNAPEGHLPWTIIPDVDPDNRQEICFRQEPFCSLMAETAIEANSIEQFVDRAVEFANETLWGTLIATLVVHPVSMRDPTIAAAVERAVDKLRYGSVVVNQAPGFAYFLMATPWGGYPGHDSSDIQSGCGIVNNVLMLPHPHKAVVRGNFNPWPDPFVVTFQHGYSFFKKFAEVQASPSLVKLPSLLATTLRG